jgi:uncharacterized DUF497 family protein
MGPEGGGTHLKKHGISFETAAGIFFDPHHVADDNYYYDAEGEQRRQIIGMTEGLVLLLVIFVDRSEDGEGEIIRIIYARKAEAYEESIYEDQFA